MKARLHPDFKDFIKSLNSYRVRYIVVGGYAVIYHGYNRTTGDLDIWVQQTRENFDLLTKALIAFGLPSNAITANEFLSNSTDVYTFGVPPVCIEVITSVQGIQFEESYKNAKKIMIDGIKLTMIDLPDLLRNKKAAGRNKDLDDIEHIG